MDLQLIATGVGMVWFALAMAKAISIHGAAQQQTKFVLFLFQDIGISDREVREAGFDKRLSFMASYMLIAPFCLISVPWFLCTERTKFFADPTTEEIADISARTMRKCILEDGRYVDRLVEYEKRLDDQPVIH